MLPDHLSALALGVFKYAATKNTCAPRRASSAEGLWNPPDSIPPENALTAELAFMLGLLAVWFECRHAGGFSFRAVRYLRAVHSRVAIAAIELCEVAGQFATHREFVGRRVPAGISRPLKKVFEGNLCATLIQKLSL